MNRSLIGATAALASIAVLSAAMLPERSNLSIATAGLVLVVPVVIGVAVGGFAPGVVSVVAGFLVFDFFFIPPYGTLNVGAGQDWAVLAVYLVVMLLVARVVASLDEARARARRRGGELRELFALSDLLVADKPLEVLLPSLTSTLADVFGSPQVALLLPREGRLRTVAHAGPGLTEEQLRRVVPTRGQPSRLESASFADDDLLVLALAAAGRPVGLLVLSAKAASRHEREPLLLFANQVALAVERAQLREQALRTQLTEEVARLAKTLVAAVSHDLRSPLASIKGASSTLADPDIDISSESARHLATVIDAQADRLATLVQNLLDMSRIQAGVLSPRRQLASVPELISSALADLGPLPRRHLVDLDLPDELPPVDVDPVLVSRVVANLVDNAARYGPKNTPITVRAGLAPEGTVEVSVTDRGPGVSVGRRQEIFDLFPRRAGDSGAGLGLTIAKTFIEAHGCRIWVEDEPGGGARFCFTLPAAAAVPEELRLVEDPHH
jgi:two-component system sensor histidine kinase KdpD